MNFAGISMKIGRGNGKDGDAGDSIGKKKDPIIMPKPKVKTSINIILK